MTRLHRLIFLSLLISIGLVLSIVESSMPVPFLAPGAKLGLANVVTLITLVILGFRDALIVGILKSITFVLATGSVSSIFYSLTGVIFSTILMYIVYKYFSNYFSLIGVSIFGAISHNIGQVMIASIMMENIMIFSYLPIMTLISLFTGYFVGLVSIFVDKNLSGRIFKL
ncbi:Gx transporter family protein [Dethiothermospora halolimnae]|uniref:Gx transporter family protein n=1 Tax=Dethiothermospora halolimnae TaxID=3114390 RepID=UPI003CCC2AB6